MQRAINALLEDGIFPQLSGELVGSLAALSKPHATMPEPVIYKQKGMFQRFEPFESEYSNHLLRTNITPSPKVFLKMIFLFPFGGIWTRSLFGYSRGLF